LHSRCRSRCSSFSAAPVRRRRPRGVQGFADRGVSRRHRQQVNVITLYRDARRRKSRSRSRCRSKCVVGVAERGAHVLHTQFGLSFLIITFDDRANAYFARQQVVERLREVDLPDGRRRRLRRSPRRSARSIATA